MHHDVSPTTEPGTARRDTACCPGAARGRCKVGCPGADTVDSLRTQLRDTQEQLERMRIAHRSEELRRIDAEINNAYLTREVMRLSGTLDSIISG